MMPGWRILVLLVLGLAGGVLGTPVIAERSPEEIRRLHQNREILPLEAIIAKHRRDHAHDKLLEAELESEHGRYIYELKVLDPDGAVNEFKYDAYNGELWRFETEPESEAEHD